MIHSINWRSTLDYYFSTQHINQLITLDKNESDHYPILANIQLNGNMKRNKKISKYIKLNINNESVKRILENENWSSISHPQINKRIIIKELRIRLTIKLQQEANKIFREEAKWETKQIRLRDTIKESFREYVLNLDLQRKNEITKFYKIINSIIKYKTKGKIVKRIKWDEEIILDKKKKQIIIKYYEYIYIYIQART